MTKKIWNQLTRLHHHRHGKNRLLFALADIVELKKRTHLIKNVPVECFAKCLILGFMSKRVDCKIWVGFGWHCCVPSRELILLVAFPMRGWQALVLEGSSTNHRAIVSRCSNWVGGNWAMCFCTGADLQNLAAARDWWRMHCRIGRGDVAMIQFSAKLDAIRDFF